MTSAIQQRRRRSAACEPADTERARSGTAGVVTGLPLVLLRSEGVALLFMATVLYGRYGRPWWLFAVLLPMPDLGLLGLLWNKHVGAVTYDLTHTYVPPAALGLVGVVTGSSLGVVLALVWFAHIGMDRALGLGLLYQDGCGCTHLREARRDRQGGWLVDRLTAQDLMMLWPEELGWSQDIGALAILDGAGLLDADGRFRIETAREEIDRRLHRVPRFRQLLYRPRFGLGWPLWVDAASIDLAQHVREFRLPAPADEPELLAACEELRHRRLSRSRPLWELWFLPGLPEGRVGLFMRLHHAIADGVAGIAALGAFVDSVPGPSTLDPRPWTPVAGPTTGELLVDNVRRRLRGLGRPFAMLAHPLAAVRLARRGWPAVREAFLEARAPRTSLSRRVGWHRRFALIRSQLDLVKQVAHAHDATVNDVLMAALACGLRALLLGRGERVDGLVLRAAVPVSLHQEEPGQAQGNLDGMMVVPLPIGEPDDVRRLRLIAAETTKRKRKHRPQGGTLFRSVAAQRAFLRLAPYQRLTNTYTANVPGPPVPLYFAGARLLEVFPVVPIWGNVSLGVGALSYAGQFNITAVADRAACPDLEVFAQGVRRALEALAASVLVGSSTGELTNRGHAGR